MKLKATLWSVYLEIPSEDECVDGLSFEDLIKENEYQVCPKNQKTLKTPCRLNLFLLITSTQVWHAAKPHFCFGAPSRERAATHPQAFMR